MYCLYFNNSMFVFTCRTKARQYGRLCYPTCTDRSVTTQAPGGVTVL